MTQPILNFLVDADGSSSSELDVPELEEAIHLGRLADYARRHDRRPRQPLFTAASAAKPSTTAKPTFDVRVVRKSSATSDPVANAVQPTNAPAPVGVQENIFRQPDPVRNRISSLVRVRRSLLNEVQNCVEGNARNAALEQTLNESRFHLPTQCHSTPYNGPAEAIVLHGPGAPDAPTQPAAVEKGVLPSNIAININLNSPSKNANTERIVVNHRTPNRNATPTSAASCMSLAPQSPRHQLLRTPISQRSRPNTPRTPIVQRSQPTTPRSALSPKQPIQRGADQRRSSPRKQHLSHAPEPALESPSSRVTRENVRQELRLSSQRSQPTSPRSTLSVNSPKQPTERGATPRRSSPRKRHSSQAPEPALKSPTSRVTRGNVRQVLRLSSEQKRKANVTAAERIEQLAADDLLYLRENSPRTSQTLQHQFMNRERPTMIENLSLRPSRGTMSQKFRTKQPKNIEAEELKKLEHSIKTASSQNERPRNLYTKGDSINASNNASAKRRSDARPQSRDDSLLTSDADDENEQIDRRSRARETRSIRQARDRSTSTETEPEDVLDSLHELSIQQRHSQQSNSSLEPNQQPAPVLQVSPSKPKKPIPSRIPQRRLLRANAVDNERDVPQPPVSRRRSTIKPTPDVAANRRTYTKPTSPKHYTRSPSAKIRTSFEKSKNWSRIRNKSSSSIDEGDNLGTISTTEVGNDSFHDSDDEPLRKKVRQTRDKRSDRMRVAVQYEDENAYLETLRKDRMKRAEHVLVSDEKQNGLQKRPQTAIRTGHKRASVSTESRDAQQQHLLAEPRPQKAKRTGHKRDSLSSESSDSQESDLPTDPRTQNVKRTGHKRVSLSSESGDSQEPDLPAEPRPQMAKRTGHKRDSLSSESSDSQEPDLPVVSRPQRAKRTGHKRLSISTDFRDLQEPNLPAEPRPQRAKRTGHRNVSESSESSDSQEPDVSVESQPQKAKRTGHVSVPSESRHLQKTSAPVLTTLAKSAREQTAKRGNAVLRSAMKKATIDNRETLKSAPIASKKSVRTTKPNRNSTDVETTILSNRRQTFDRTAKTSYRKSVNRSMESDTDHSDDSNDAEPDSQHLQQQHHTYFGFNSPDETIPETQPLVMEEDDVTNDPIATENDAAAHGVDSDANMQLRMDSSDSCQLSHAEHQRTVVDKPAKKPKAQADKNTRETQNNKSVFNRDKTFSKNPRKRNRSTRAIEEYHPYDRKEPVETDPNVRKSKRTHRPPIKYWVNTIQTRSPLYRMPDTEKAPKKPSRKPIQPGRKPTQPGRKRKIIVIDDSNESDDATTPAIGSSTTNVCDTLHFPTDGFYSEMLSGSYAGQHNRLAIYEKDAHHIMQIKMGHSADGIDYYEYPRNEGVSRGYMRFAAHARKRRCRNHYQCEIHVKFGVLSVEIEGFPEKEYTAGSVILIPLGLKYTLRNRNEALALAYFCKRAVQADGDN